MKLFIASDIHGDAKCCEVMLRRFKEEKADRMLLLGDILYHGPRNGVPNFYDPEKVARILNGLKEKIVAVRGNCEAEVDQMVLPFPCMADYAVLEADGITFYLTHGHLHAPDHLPPLQAGTVFLSGHTHIKLDQMAGDIRCLNPGSVSIPKDGSHSCLIYENGSFRFCILEESL